MEDPVSIQHIDFLVQDFFAFCEEVKNTKSEFRISKQIQNSDLSMTETKWYRNRFQFRILAIRVCFGFRVSIFTFGCGRRPPWREGGRDEIRGVEDP